MKAPLLRRPWPTCFVVAALSTVALAAESGFERRYAKGYELQPADEAEVLRIARANGVSDIQAIVSSSTRDVTVTEREVANGRVITFRFVNLMDVSNRSDPNRVVRSSF